MLRTVLRQITSHFLHTASGSLTPAYKTTVKDTKKVYQGTRFGSHQKFEAGRLSTCEITERYRFELLMSVIFPYNLIEMVTNGQISRRH